MDNNLLKVIYGKFGSNFCCLKSLRNENLFRLFFLEFWKPFLYWNLKIWYFWKTIRHPIFFIFFIFYGLFFDFKLLIINIDMISPQKVIALLFGFRLNFGLQKFLFDEGDLIKWSPSLNRSIAYIFGLLLKSFGVTCPKSVKLKNIDL